MANGAAGRVERKRAGLTGAGAVCKLSAALERSPVPVAIADPAGIVEYVNSCFTSQTGYDADEVVGRPLGQLAAMPGEAGDTLPSVSADSGEWRGELLRRRKDGSVFAERARVSMIEDDLGAPGHLLIIGEDVTARTAYEERLYRQARYDTLTGLPNRLLLLERLREASARTRTACRPLAVLFVNLDHIRAINETLGHDAGDRLLIEASRRLSGLMSTDDVLARFGGNQFVVVLPNLPAAAFADAYAHRILAAIAEPFVMEGREFTITASIGITLSGPDGDDVHTLLRHADAAMRRAKVAGRNTFRFFTAELNRRVSERRAMESRLRHAVARKELFIEYQPIIDAKSGCVAAAEALVRWHHPELGLIRPDHFIPLAEETGLIVGIGEWVMREACREARDWEALAGRPLTLSVNVSACQFRGLELARVVAEAARDGGLDHGRLEIEITERLLIETAAPTLALLEELHDMGVHISIDDFGTGYSSLSYLKHLPVQTLKIDRSFVKDVPTGPRDTALVSAIIALARNLGLGTVAEGVETREQLDFLRQHHCDLIQGYYFSRPLPAPAFRAYLANAPSAEI